MPKRTPGNGAAIPEGLSGKPPEGVARRNFLRAATAAAVAGTTAGCGVTNSPYRFFSLPEANTLAAICNRVIPDDQSAGAVQAGVVHYIDRQLNGKFREHRKIYRAGLAATDRLAGGNFAEVPVDRQTAILHQTERDPAIRPFFDLVIAHSMQGFYASPRHGGNRDFASWRMLGIPVTPVRGRDRYEFTSGGASEKS